MIIFKKGIIPHGGATNCNLVPLVMVGEIDSVIPQIEYRKVVMRSHIAWEREVFVLYNGSKGSNNPIVSFDWSFKGMESVVALRFPWVITTVLLEYRPRCNFGLSLSCHKWYSLPGVWDLRCAFYNDFNRLQL